MRVLIVDDDELLCNTLKKSLEADSYSVDICHDGERGSFAARTNDYDIILLDNMMPRKTGARVCQEIRDAGKMTPIIMLSIQSAIASKVASLERGVDDYLAKPFSYDELRARIKAVLRRPQKIKETVLTISDLTIDCNKQKTTRGLKDIYLTRKEFALLEFLMRNKGNVVARGMIMEHVWNSEADPFSNTIEAHIMNLRKKIDGKRKEKDRLIHNVPGRGYKVEMVIKRRKFKKNLT